MMPRLGGMSEFPTDTRTEIHRVHIRLDDSYRVGHIFEAEMRTDTYAKMLAECQACSQMQTYITTVV